MHAVLSWWIDVLELQKVGVFLRNDIQIKLGGFQIR